MRDTDTEMLTPLKYAVVAAQSLKCRCRRREAADCCVPAGRADPGPGLGVAALDQHAAPGFQDAAVLRASRPRSSPGHDPAQGHPVSWDLSLTRLHKCRLQLSMRIYSWCFVGQEACCGARRRIFINTAAHRGCEQYNSSEALVVIHVSL